MNKIKILTALLSISILTGLAGCGKQSSNSSSTKKVINLMQTAPLTSLNNTNQATLPEFNTLTNISEGLYQLNDKDHPTPAMATKVVKPTDGGKKYIFEIRKDAKWSNGDPVKAEDFEYSWKQSVNPSNNPVYTYIFSGIKNADAINKHKKSYKTLGIKALSTRKLEITLDHPMSYFNKLVTMPVFMPQDKSFVAKVGKKYGTNSDNTVSNGAFKISGWTGTNDNYKLTRNPYYYDKKAIHIDQINYKVVKDPNTANELFETKKLDDAVISGVTAKGLQHNKNIKLVPKAWTYYLQVNQSNGQPFKNQNLRKAISLVIDRNELTKNILSDGSTPASSFVSPRTSIDPNTGKDFSKETSTSTTPNIDEARKLWEKGIKEVGKSQKIKLSIIGDNQQVTKNVAEFLQGQISSNLKGVQVSVNNLPDKSFQNARSGNKWNLSQWYWLADFADPINYLGILTTGNTMNPGHFSDKTYDRLVSDAQSANNQKDYWKDLRAAEKRLQKITGVIPLYYVKESHLVNPKLSGVEYHVSGFTNYSRANISK